MTIKPGYKTSEFWLTMVSFVFSGLYLVGMLDSNNQKEVDFESGQFLINKTKCYKELCVTMWMNEHSDWFYSFIYGDKSTYHLAWRKCGTPYSIPEKNAGWVWPAIQQYDMNGELLFQHACRGKESIFSGDNLHNIHNREYVYEAARVRKKYWSGRIFSWEEMSPEEKILAESLTGRYVYTRIGLDSRHIALGVNGDITQGKAKCERRWSLRLINNIPTIIVIGAAHKDSEIATFMARPKDSFFMGRWTVFEKCEVSLTKLNDPTLTHNMTRKAIEECGQSNATKSNPAKIINSFYLYTDPEELSIGRWLANTGYWEAWNTSWITKNIKPGFTCIDLGANYGYYTRIMEKLSGPDGLVYSIEANGSLIRLIKKSIEDYPIKNGSKVIFYELAAADYNGETILKIPKKNIGGASIVFHHQDSTNEEWYDLKVKTARLDDIIDNHIDLIKMDIEAAEPLAWKGMQNLLNKTDTIFMELGPYSPLEFITEIYSKYKVWKVDLQGNEIELSRNNFDKENDLIMVVLRKK